MCNQPSQVTYNNLMKAYKHFNRTLFDNRLPECLIVLHRKRGARGYFWADQWVERKGQKKKTAHEIALNPQTFRGRKINCILSTLVHEMCHLEQEVFGKPSRNAYHNKEWAEMMLRVGLIPSDTGKPGGKMTGQRVTHYTEKGGKFEKSCRTLTKQKGFDLPYEARDYGTTKVAKKKRESKTKYTCPECGQNVWAKPEANLMCGECKVDLAVNIGGGMLVGDGA